MLDCIRMGRAMHMCNDVKQEMLLYMWEPTQKRQWTAWRKQAVCGARGQAQPMHTASCLNKAG